MFESVLIADRGLIACRVRSTLKRLGVRAITIHSENDRHAAHGIGADRAVCVGATESDSYSNGAAVLDAARISGARAIHPGQSRLSRNAAFARATEKSGLAFLGPSPEQLRALSEPDSLAKRVGELGIPLLPEGPGPHARQLLVQLFGDGNGGVWSLGECDQSVRRSGSAMLAETPGPNLDTRLGQALADAALSLARSLRYRSFGSVEFLVDLDRLNFYFLGFRPYLAAEHALAEAVLGIDLVEWMLELSSASPPVGKARELQRSGCAVQAQVVAQDPSRDFRPSGGLLTELDFPAEVRVDRAYERGDLIQPDSDPLLATLTVRAGSRLEALSLISDVLHGSRVGGLETNLSYLAQALHDPLLLAGQLSTRILERVAPGGASIEVLSSGPLSIVVDYPGRLGYWAVGIPPSGPMDPLAHRLANRCVGNPEWSAALELTLSGPKLKFSCEAVVALAGANLLALLDGEPVSRYRPIRVRAGQTLSIGAVEGPGCRASLAVRGGFQVPAYLGSKTTFTLGGFGGHAGRALGRSDILHIGQDVPVSEPTRIPAELIPLHDRSWQVGVLYGPHGAPDFFTERDIAMLFSTEWEVHFNSNRTGVRLMGPKPEWARPDGGEAGLHPSNIHDLAYAVGAIDFTGDMPILLGPDGPSLGGFVCPATVVFAELWKLGQLRAGDRVRFVPITPQAAAQLEQDLDRSIARLEGKPSVRLAPTLPRAAIVSEIVESAEQIRVVYRRAGDKNLLVEYGPLVLDLRLRFRVHALMRWLEDARISGIIDLTPGIRSLQVHFDSRQLTSERLLDALAAAERELPPVQQMVVPTRIVHLPLSWDDPATRLAIRKYTQSVRSDAPWCPSNIEFIRRINGLDSTEDVQRIVFEASYLVLGLGDVYLGAPVATPVDPRHRLVTTKYNPARTWTPENAVGIGGAYLCVYGMEGPGGYQFVGRTLQVFNRFRRTREFPEGSPWLLRFFDQIRFYPVSSESLLDMRQAFPHGKLELKIESSEFRLSDYQTFLEQNQTSIARSKARQQAAFDAERQRWIASGQLGSAAPKGTLETDRPPNPLTGSLESGSPPSEGA